MDKELCSKWEMLKINDVCSLITDGTHQTPTYSDDGYVFLSSKNVTTGSIDWNNVKYVGDELHQKLYKRLAPQYNDILLAKNGTTGVCAKVDRDIIFDIYVSLALLRPKTIINSDYFVFAINNPYTKRKFDSHLKGIGVPNLHLSIIKDIKIPLPPLEIQEEISKNLDLASDLVKLHKTRMEELDKLIQSVFYDMFGDPVTNEKGWESVKLGDICKIYRGASPRPIEQYLGGTVPWIKIGDATIGDNVFILNTKEKITEDGAKKSRLIKSGGLIFANCGVSLGFARILKIDGCIHDGWLAFENYENKLDSLFFLKALNFCTFYFRKIAPDGTQPNLNTGIMKSYMQIVPPLSLQQKFANIVTEIETQKIQVQKALNDSEMLYNSLMQDYFE